MNKCVHPEDYRPASPSHDHPLTTSLTGAKNSSPALSNACAQAHLYTQTRIQIQREFAIPVLPSGWIVATGTNMAAPEHSKASFLAATADDCTWLHVIICH